jgi:hypothetical protein
VSPLGVKLGREVEPPTHNGAPFIVLHRIFVLKRVEGDFAGSVVAGVAMLGPDGD